MDKKEVVVVVPVYRPELTVWERASLRQTVGVLQENYPVELLVPCGMDCSAIRREFSGLPVREVSDEWLGRKNGIAGYNRMMLSAGFYELFRDYEYLLICHTDAWIFRDELADWCRRGYDCVAAPWVRRKVYDLPILKQYLRWRLRRAERAGRMIRQSLYGKIGNGGLSLRRVESFRAACENTATRSSGFVRWATTWATRMFSGPSFPKGFVILRRRRRCGSRSTPIPAIATVCAAVACRWGAIAGRSPGCGASGSRLFRCPTRRAAPQRISDPVRQSIDRRMEKVLAQPFSLLVIDHQNGFVANLQPVVPDPYREQPFAQIPHHASLHGVVLNLDPPLHLEQNIEQPCRVSLEPLARQDEHVEMREAVVAEEHPVEIRQVGRIFFCDHLPCGQQVAFDVALAIIRVEVVGIDLRPGHDDIAAAEKAVEVGDRMRCREEGFRANRPQRAGRTALEVEIAAIVVQPDVVCVVQVFQAQ